MKKIIFLCCSLIAVAWVQAQDPVISINPSSLSEELFTGENAVQILTVSNSGTAPLNGTATVQPLSFTGLVNNALQFDGSNDYCVIYNDAVLQLSEDLTIEAWVNFEEGGTGQPALISKGRPVPHYEVFFDTTLATRKIGLGLDPVGTVLSQTTLVAGTWYHVAFTYDGSMMKIFINGELDASQAATGDLNSSNYGLYFGKRDNTTNHKFKGILDEVRIWHVARSQDDIRHAMNHEFTQADTGMSGYWNCNEASGTKANDLTIYSNNANLISGVAHVASEARIINWLDANPVSFSVAPGTSMDLAALFNSFEMPGGTYAGQIDIKSNDPAASLVLIPVQLDVIPVPNILLSQTQLNFGEIFINMTKSLTFQVLNDGNDTLRIESITCQNPDFQVEPSALKVAPNEAFQVEVTYSPISSGIDVADLILASNDPDLPQAAVQLIGTALSPPVITVSPGNFDINLYSGRTMQQLFTVTNAGESDLDFDLVNNAIEMYGSDGYVQTGNPALYRLDAMTLELWLAVNDSYNTGGIITLGNNGSERFSLWMSSGQLYYQHNWESGADDAVLLPNPGYYDWHHLAVTYQSSTLRFYLDGALVKTSAIQAPENFEEGYALYFGNEIGGWTDYLNGRMDEVRIWNYARSQGEIQEHLWSNLSGTEAGLVGYWKFEEMEGEMIRDMSNNENHGLLMGNLERVEWPITPSWMVNDPVSGSCDPGESVDISLMIDACNLCGGDHLFDIMVSSNDPVHPVMQVPVILGITDAPCISVSADTLDFGTLYIGFDTSDTLFLDIQNRGSLDLLITGITASPGAFSASPGFAGIDPGESETFAVIFSPTSVGTYSGTLLFASNDPLDEEYSIIVKGRYLVAPAVSLTPASIQGVLYSGKQTGSSFSIHNTGGSDLEYSLSQRNTSALTMDGLDDYIYWSSFNPVNNLPLSQFTFECWMNIEPNSYNSQPIFNASVCYGNYNMYIDLTSDQRVHFSLYDNNWNYHELYSSPIEASQWVHLACTYDGGAQKIYLNGIENTSTSWSGTFSLTGYGMIGRQSSWYYYSYLHGFLDEVRIWNDGRTSAEIHEFMNVELSGSEEALIGYWKFDQLNGNLVMDMTAHQNNGYVYGSPVLTEFTPPVSSWIISEPAHGICPMNSSVAIQVTFDASFMRGGIYESEIMVYSNDPDDPVVGVEVSLEVIDAPSVQTLVEEIDFGQVFIGYPVTRYLEVTNNGSQDLLVTEMVAEPGVFSTTPPYLSIDPGETETISVQFSPLNSIPYSGSLTLVNNDPLQEEYVIDLAGEGLVAPVIGISTTMLDVSLEPGDTEQRSVSVMNSGGSGLQYSITPSSNQCLSFDGVGNYIQVPAFSPVQNVYMSDFTFETWVFFNDFEASDQYLFSASSSYYYYPIEVRTTSDQRIRFFIYDNYGNYREVYSSVLDPDTWYHIACVYDGDAQKIFINGQEEATYNWYGHFTITSGFTVGKHYNYSSGYLDGILDETRIWQVSKTAAGIQQDMYREIPTATPGLISCWTYDNIEGNMVVDQSGFYNDGTISGEVQFADLQSPLHEWLSVSPGSGNCPPNGNINSTVVFDATGMAIGDYYRTMRIASNDPEFPVVTIPVHMLVGYGVGTGGNEEGGLTSVFCYPNPFSGSVKIRYFLAEEGKVTLVVFDQLGQKVAVLCDEAQTAGSHEVTWNAEGLPGGVYFYRLTAGRQVSATGGKLILLR